MIRASLIRLAFSLLSLGGIAAAQAQSSRNLTGYANGGSYTFNWRLRADEVEKVKERIRSFLWEKWQQKQLAYVTFRDCTIYPEGCADSTIYRFYIEPGKKGGWQLTEEADHFIAAELNGGKEDRQRSYTVIFTNIEQVGPEEAETCLPFFSEKLDTRSRAFRLRFIYDRTRKDLSRNCITF